MQTAAQIRQTFLDFFREKKHTIVPSGSLLPDSPNLLFTNAGMNQFVPIFLGEKKADVSKWGGVIPGADTRAADTQKCIRAGGKHNDLDDVGLDTYHHTFFEMLGNWSFGDYFKKEAIAWSWELIVERFGFPPNRVYATIYQPDPGDPSERDQEAYDLWAEKFVSVGLDPAVHIVNGNKKDNFWMMGETGPCGPCSEIHIDLTPEDRTPELEARGSKLVNAGVPECIEIWNNVFIQFNAEPATPDDALKMQEPNAKVGVDWQQKFVPLPAKHVDTGMGFERLTSIIQGTKDFTDFANAKISNYETDIFRPIFDELEKMSGLRYASTLPSDGRVPESPGSIRVPRVGEGVPPSRTSQDAPSEPHAASDRDTDESSFRRDAETNTRDAYAPQSSQIQIDIAFRVIADHIRTLSFAIADGIQPGNNDRNYVLRRILRRAVKYGRTLGFKEPFFYKLVAVLARTMGDVFPEIRAKQKLVEDTLKREEAAFNKTLDRGMAIFSQAVGNLMVRRHVAEEGRKMRQVCVDYANTLMLKFPNDQGAFGTFLSNIKQLLRLTEHVADENARFGVNNRAYDELDALHEKGEVANLKSAGSTLISAFSTAMKNFSGFLDEVAAGARAISGELAFKLYDTYGFPLDLTELMARELSEAVDVAGFEAEMEKQRARARAAQKRQVIELSEIETKEPTQFVGYDSLETAATVLEVVTLKDRTAVVLDATACYGEMGGQVGDSGEIACGGQLWNVLTTQKSGATFLHFIESVMGEDAPAVGSAVTLSVDAARRAAIQRHHTVTHLLHWALHEVVSREATQKGSFVGPDKLTFDFNSAALTPAQVRDIERLVNARIVENAGVVWNEVPYADVRGRADIMQFFGDKYGEIVRLVDIGGFSKELCAGTHTRATGEIGLFRIESEAAIAAGVRRIEAVAGLNAYDCATADMQRLHALAGKMGSPLADLEKRIDGMIEQQKHLEKLIKISNQRQAAQQVKELILTEEKVNGIPVIIANVGERDGDTLQGVADAFKAHGFKGVVVLGGAANGAVALVASVSPDFTAKVQAGKLISAIAPIVGGKGGGKPDNARGGGKDPSQLDAALAHAKTLLAGK